MNSQRSNCLLKALLFFNVWLLTLATDNFQLEASFDGNLETSFGTASAFSLLNGEVDVPTTSSHYFSESDPLLFKTLSANENLGVFNQLGIKIDDGLLHGNLGHAMIRSHAHSPAPQIVASKLCSVGGKLVPILGSVCSAASSSPSEAEPAPPAPSEAESAPPASSPDRYAYLTNNPPLIGTVSQEHRSLILPSKVKSLIVNATCS